ncbi:hypothetical protein KOW79_021764 [Hemibagrus wyckioides]|uniref:FIIND domain-containing protein n=1 Tax=Hemibagrus wyckioides TaxID=337641 RepID=A0A9D3N1U5_9TELE|nr:hypothetical protein KOW79_021764 [Hemibagrus wyckioides]
MLQGKEWLSDEIVCVTKKSILILDPLGKETLYERKVLRNWRNFLKLQGRDEHSAAWQAQTLPHEEQQDSSSCGLLILKFAELCLLEGSVQDVKTSESAISLDRIEIACALLTYRGKAEDYCVVCSMLEVNAEKSMIEMVQCDLCGRSTERINRGGKSEIEKFECDYGPNYHPTFEMLCNIEVDKVTLGLLDENDQEVWERLVFLTGTDAALPKSDTTGKAACKFYF